MRALFGLIRPCLTTRAPWRAPRPAQRTRPPWTLTHARWKADTTTAQEVENTNVSHSRFIAEAAPQTQWREGRDGTGESDQEPTQDEFDGVAEGKGKLSPTSTHLFKLILPLGHLARTSGAAPPSAEKTPPPTVFLLHPSQPLSHVARLVTASLAPAAPTISFRSRAHQGGDERQWSDATDVADFVRDAAQATEFTIHIAGVAPAAATTAPPTSSPSSAGSGNEEGGKAAAAAIVVDVPTFADRTRFLRRRLERVGEEMKGMEDLKALCDREAHRGARRLALGGFGALVCYWGAVARLTFWDLGWDVMEPVTYLSGLSMVICGYLWFLYKGREVSYSSVLDQSISTRREALYAQRGFDIERWLELVAEARALRREIATIAQDYDRWKGDPGARAAAREGKGDGGEDDGGSGGDGKGAGADGDVESGPGESDAEHVKKEARRGEGTPLTEANSRLG